MGQLLALLRPTSEPTLPPVATVNLIDPQASAKEQEALAETIALLSRSKEILSLLKDYPGCEEQIRAAISQPGPQNDGAAWEAVVPCVTSLKGCYEFALVIERLLPAILGAFCEPNASGVVDVQANLEAHQATAKVFADILSFGWEFDELKVAKPAIQNDFSYYRRTVSRMRNTAAAHAPASLPVPDDLANRMSMFWAYPNPFLKLLTDTVAAYVVAHELSVPVSNSLLLIATVCHNAVNTHSPVSALFALRTMTGCLLMYDYIHPVGLFPKASEVNMRMFVKAIQVHGGSASTTLLNSLRYSTKTFGSPDVPKPTKALFDAPA
ncbi:hypothetical protein BC828DRAFT_393414 [Blastocladiella britannica]|nr:hypothetical protein BC828DRAFT_393414 [Blastocladiella britannica]